VSQDLPVVMRLSSDGSTPVAVIDWGQDREARAAKSGQSNLRFDRGYHTQAGG